MRVMVAVVQQQARLIMVATRSQDTGKGEGGNLPAFLLGVLNIYINGKS